MYGVRGGPRRRATPCASRLDVSADTRSGTDARSATGLGCGRLIAAGLVAFAPLLLANGPPGRETQSSSAGRTPEARRLGATPNVGQCRGGDRCRPLAQLSLPLTPAKARAFNASVPFASSDGLPARPFTYQGSGEDRERALTCLTSAAWYEAGDDRTGQQAVVQVVLNRLRHPAFPKTVCNVIFQGAARTTGCQFTFACDGSLRRRPDDAAWKRAREVAEAALSGFVFRQVGMATHYHTDWVVPYWSASLEKLTKVHSHLFFRWRGEWGKRAAFTGELGGNEVMDPRIADLVDPNIDHPATPGRALPEAPLLLADAVPGLLADAVPSLRADAVSNLLAGAVPRLLADRTPPQVHAPPKPPQRWASAVLGGQPSAQASSLH
jgi:hypothetical protein